MEARPLRLRFAEADNLSLFNFGVDHVTLNVSADEVAATPEPASLTLLGIAGVSVGGYSWRRRKAMNVAC